jgi:hypothetical protein
MIMDQKTFGDLVRIKGKGFHFRQCPGCLDIIKYPNFVTDNDPAPVCNCSVIGFYTYPVEVIKIKEGDISGGSY